MIFPTLRVWVFLAFASCLSRLALAVDIQPPAVAILQPATGATLSGKAIVVEVIASDANGVTNVALKVNGAAFGTALQVPPYSFPVDTTKLANGVHTIHAVATDGAGTAARSAIISITVTNLMRYTLGPGPFVVEDLGSLLSANTQEKQIMFRHTQSGDLHLVLYYVTTDLTRPIQLLDANLSQGTARLTNTIPGRPGPNASCYDTNNNKLYMASSLGDPSYLMEYDPVTGGVRTVSVLHYRGAQYMEFGDDGWLYIGEYNSSGGGAVERYNPSTDTFEDLGIMDTNQTAPQYSYTVGADQRFVYVGLGQQPWYLAVYDKQTGVKTNYWKSEGDTTGAVWHGRDGLWYYWRVPGTGGDALWYQLTNGVAVSIPPKNPGVDMISYNYESGNTIRYPGFFPTRCNTEVNLDQAYPDNSSNHAVIKWRSVGGTNWQSVAVSGFHLRPVNIKRLYSWDTNQFFGFADFYGPVFRYNIATGSTVTLGRPQYSLCDAIFQQDAVYFSGYPSATLAYIPSNPWTLTLTTPNKSSPAVNPHLLPIGFGKYHYYSTFGADGMVYVGAHHERDSTGGELGWYDPMTGTSGSLRAPFEEHDVRDLKPALGGTKLVYSSNRTNLFVFDVATKSIERTIVPLPEVASLDKVVEVSPGIIFGATGSNIFKVNIQTGAVLYTNAIPGAAFGGSAILTYDRRLATGPDGYVWMFIGNSLYRIDPRDCSLFKILDSPAKMLVFKDNDLYLYGGPNLYRIKGALRVTVPSPSNLQIISQPPN